MNKPDIYETITNRFIEQLKKGSVPWQKSWLAAQNLVSQKPYQGINALLLGCTDYKSPFWVTFRQSLDLGGNVRKGEKSMPIIFYKFLEKRNAAGQIERRADGTAKRVPLVRWSNVFNLDQTVGIQAPNISVSRAQAEPLERAAAIVKEAKVCPIHQGGFSPVYLPKLDVIRVPEIEKFHSPQDYHHELFHEMSHSTGHSSRLNRDGVTKPVKFGSEHYCKEELIAEISAAFLSNEAGILDQVRFENSAAYVDSWISHLQKDPHLIVSAASQAQRSANFILGIEQKELVAETQLSPEGMPRTVAREQGLDTRIHGFGQRDADGDGVPNAMEWKNGTKPMDRFSTPAKRGMSL